VIDECILDCGVISRWMPRYAECVLMSAERNTRIRNREEYDVREHQGIQRIFGG
jgi:hypothetical protein